MKFSLSWFKEHLDTNADIHAIADCLNRIVRAPMWRGTPA